MSRRHALRLGITVAGGLVLLACSSESKKSSTSASPTSGGSGGTAKEVEAVKVVLVPYPFWDGTVITKDPELLDALANEYADGRPAGELDVKRFLFGDVPVAAFDRIFTGDVERALDQAGGLLWAFYLSGYFGGRWLRSAIDTAQPGTSRLAGVQIAPSEDGFRAMAARAERGIEVARSGDDDAVIELARASLVPDPAVTQSFTGSGLAENMGYNTGYLLQILEAPPEGLTTPDEYQVRCPPDALFGCEYESPKSAALADLAGVQAALNAREGAYAALFDELKPLQDAKIPTGRGVWSGGLSVQGFPQTEYEQLLDVSSSYLEDVQATALATTQAVAEDDPAVGRRAALANSCMGVWLSGYSTGLTEGGATELPTLEPA